MSNTPFTDAARELLADLMTNEGVSARALSRRTGVADTTIAMFLKSRKCPSLTTYERMLSGLGVELVLDVRPA